MCAESMGDAFAVATQSSQVRQASGGLPSGPPPGSIGSLKSAGMHQLTPIYPWGRLILKVH